MRNATDTKVKSNYAPEVRARYGWFWITRASTPAGGRR